MLKNNKVVKIMLDGLLIVFGFLLIMYILLQLFIPKSTIDFFGFKPYTVITMSMEPVINKDDIAVVRKPDLDNLQVGDIITFEADIDFDLQKEVVTHYIHSIIIENGQRSFRTARHDKTTNAPSLVPDAWWLTDNDIIGVYWFKIPKLGILANFLKSPFGIATVTVNLIIIGVIVYLVKSDKKDKLNQPTQ